MGLFTHARASPNFTIIPMCTPDVAVPCLCDAGQGREMPLRHRTIGSSRALTLVVPCVPTPQLPPCTIAHLTPDTLSILTLLAFHHSPSALSIPLSFPNRPSPILATFLSTACVLKRFPLTSPRKLPLTCVKRGFLRTAEPHRTSQLSPCAPQVSQCHVYVMSGSDVACPAPSARCHAPALHHRILPRAKSCLAMCPNPTAPALRNRTSDSRHTFHPLPTRFHSLSLLTFPHSPAAVSIPLSSPHPPYPILVTFLSTACVLKRFSLTSPRKLAPTCVKRGFLRTAEPH